MFTSRVCFMKKIKMITILTVARMYHTACKKQKFLLSDRQATVWFVFLYKFFGDLFHTISRGCCFVKRLQSKVEFEIFNTEYIHGNTINTLTTSRWRAIRRKLRNENIIGNVREIQNTRHWCTNFRRKFTFRKFFKKKPLDKKQIERNGNNSKTVLILVQFFH